MPRVLITGATGFVGSFLLERYAALGWEVHGTYRDPGYDRSWIPAGAPMHCVDLLDRTAVERLVAEVRPDVVQHLAAQSSVGVARRDPLRTLTNNATMQFHLLEAILAHRWQARVVVVGSCDEYGCVAADHNPIDEGQQLLPLNAYALSKVVQDLMGYEYFARQGMQVVRARPFLQLGPRRSDRFVAGAFARQIAEILAGRQTPPIRVGSIDLVRDFTDVRDVATALLLLAQDGEPGEVYNIATGRGHTLRQMLQTMLRVAGIKAEIESDAALLRDGEPPLLLGDAGKLHAATGWQPTIDFEQSVTDTLRYWIERQQLAAAVPGGTA